MQANLRPRLGTSQRSATGGAQVCRPHGTGTIQTDFSDSVFSALSVSSVLDFSWRVCGG